MNRSDQAQKGFKTFLLTMSVSLLVFSIIYYVITNTSTTSFSDDIESDDVSAANEKESSPFAKLADQEIKDIPERAVLAGTDDLSGTTTQTTQTTTGVPVAPNGGVLSITVGFFGSLAAFLLGMFVIYKDPRRLAISSFENKMIKDQD